MFAHSSPAPPPPPQLLQYLSAARGGLAAWSFLATPLGPVSPAASFLGAPSRRSLRSVSSLRGRAPYVSSHCWCSPRGSRAVSYSAPFPSPAAQHFSPPQVPGRSWTASRAKRVGSACSFWCSRTASRYSLHTRPIAAVVGVWQSGPAYHSIPPHGLTSLSSGAHCGGGRQFFSPAPPAPRLCHPGRTALSRGGRRAEKRVGSAQLTQRRGVGSRLLSLTPRAPRSPRRHSGASQACLRGCPGHGRYSLPLHLARRLPTRVRPAPRRQCNGRGVWALGPHAEAHKKDTDA